MHNKAWYILLAMHFWVIPAMGCNICSGNSNVQGIGLNGIHNSNLVLLNCAVSRFHSEHLSGFDDRMVTTELMGKFDLGGGVKISAVIPYKWAWRTTPERTNSLDGWGDLKLVLSKLLFDNKAIGKLAAVSLEFGMGLSFPTASQGLIKENPDLPVNFLGNSKSWALLAEATAVFRMANTGLILEGNFTIPFENSARELAGKSVGANVLAFHQFNLADELSLFPALGISFYQNGDYKLADGTYLFGSSGRSISLPMSCSIRFGSLMLGLTHAVPLFQDYGRGEIDLKSKSSFNLSFIF